MSFSDLEINITPEEGFTKNDLFNHIIFGERLAGLISEATVPLAIALDAHWGIGKTTFLKMWAGYLRQEKFPVIEFDAFANDYHDDPFIPLAGELVELIREKTPNEKTMLDKAAKVGIAIAKGGSKIGAKALTLGLVDGRISDDLGKDIADAIGEYTEKAVKNLISSHKKQKDELESFKSYLSKIPSKLSNLPKNADGSLIGKRPLIFIIDELDRCRPDWALKLLERVKHFYSVPNVHFVFGVHHSQLENSVSYAYGKGIDAEDYLKKFFSLRISLPEKTKERTIDRCESFLLHAMKNIPSSISKRIFAPYCKNNNITNRQIERFLQYSSLIKIDNVTDTLNSYLTILLILKFFDKKNYNKVISNSLPVNDGLEIIRSFDIKNSGYIELISDLLSGRENSNTFQATRIDSDTFSNRKLEQDYLSWENIVLDS